VAFVAELETLLVEQRRAPFRILSLDGGGAKGFHTLGVPLEIEGILNAPLCERRPCASAVQ
jgi:patatin-like phospholipase/acyl hydrolase